MFGGWPPLVSRQPMAGNWASLRSLAAAVGERADAGQGCSAAVSPSPADVVAFAGRDDGGGRSSAALHDGIGHDAVVGAASKQSGEPTSEPAVDDGGPLSGAAVGYVDQEERG
jgi:hypothetical protein